MVNVKIYHNNILRDGIESDFRQSKACVYIGFLPDSWGNSVGLLNNSMVSHNNGSVLFIQGLNDTFFFSNYNNGYSNENQLVNFGDSVFVDLSEWQTRGFDSSSVSVDPFYNSGTDLHVSNPLLDGEGVYLSEVTHDIDGELRNDPPDIGADEFVSIQSKFIRIVSPNTGDNICANDTLNISWESIGVSMVNIFLFNLIDNTYQKIEDEIQAQFGVYNWTVPSDLSNIANNQIIVFEDGNTEVTDTSGKFSVFKPYLETRSAEICKGGNYTFPDGTTQENITDTLTHESKLSTKYGCDSSIVITVFPVFLDTSVTVQDPLLSSNDNNAFYQWINCEDFTIIPGATGKSYKASSNGIYAVILQKYTEFEDLCIDTSACFAIQTAGINENSLELSILARPNPFQDKSNIDFGKNMEKLKVSVKSVLGELIYSGIYKNISNINLKFTAPSGIYFMELSDGKQAKLIRIVKE